MEEERKAGLLAKGTQGQLAGKQVGTAKGQGKAKGKVSGASPKDAPETDVKTLKDMGIDVHLADRARKAAATPEMVGGGEEGAGAADAAFAAGALFGALF
jgi:hypothetical protein